MLSFNVTLPTQSSTFAGAQGHMLLDFAVGPLDFFRQGALISMNINQKSYF